MVSTEETLPLVPPSAPRRRRRWLTVLVWLMVVPFVIWTAARLLGLESGFPTVQLIAFTPYVAVASLVPLAIAILTKRIWPAVVVAVATIALAACVLPRMIADSDPGTEDGPSLRVMTVNMLMGRADPVRIVNLIREHKVDLLALQEFTEEARGALRRAGLETELPNTVSYPRPGVGGSAVYSRFEVSDKGYRRFSPPFGQAQAGVKVPGAKDLYVESVHPCAPAPTTDRDECFVDDLAAQPAATPDGPTVNVLLGDFNSTIDHEAFRGVLDKGYRDAADVVGAGCVGSWPYDDRWFIPAVQLDHVVADKRVGVRKVSAHQVAGSDHKAVYAELVLPKA
ncbi:endonuclease/exonuclease/phosphatase family protein [Dactylosporangium sp. AC04546]|uniref:endonuclease/exonuclease/phosphatase family protein n=1 Tax=Dactylosporangium sp. AC04546 TaxID=2862460 RepID=UPI001EDD2C78|nr:endonuclease/exonuclease/phosphatase family protein [Dactylosporangium sp. AC04546]WVK85179.1 endonuclease/exonuclease/phosphatase family protein [Dactylosporangium sp. AC04546]